MMSSLQAMKLDLSLMSFKKSQNCLAFFEVTGIGCQKDISLVENTLESGVFHRCNDVERVAITCT